MANEKILLVDDDPEIVKILKDYLEAEQYRVITANNGQFALQQIHSERPDCVILDVMLPDEDGWSVTRKIRTDDRVSTTPIILLTARVDDTDKIIGLEMGADDYLPKPFNPRELLARAKAVLRRKIIEAPGAPSMEEQVVEFGEYKLNLATREMSANGEAMSLTSGEFAVLKSLVTHPREPLSRDKLMNLARGRDYSALERSIDVQVSRLRRMLEVDPANPRYIQTVWGLGYVFVPDGEKQG